MLRLPKVIGLTGRAGAGKSTVARLLMAHHGYQIMPFAKPLKEALKAMGLTEAQVNGDEKEIPLDHFCGKTPRQLMQTLGTEWGREGVGSDLWIRLWLHHSEGRRVIADDVRFVNEVLAVQRRDGVVIRVERPGTPATRFDAHASERALDTIDVDYTIRNDGDLVALRGEVTRVLRSIGNDTTSDAQALSTGHTAAAE